MPFQALRVSAGALPRQQGVPRHTRAVVHDERLHCAGDDPSAAYKLPSLESLSNRRGYIKMTRSPVHRPPSLQQLALANPNPNTAPMAALAGPRHPRTDDLSIHAWAAQAFVQDCTWRQRMRLVYTLGSEVSSQASPAPV